MKKIVFLIAILLGAVSVSAAPPLRSGVYVNAKVGILRETIKKEEQKDDMSFPGAVALGLRIRHFRLEAEYMFSTETSMEDYRQEISTITAQLYYDVPFKSAIRPFFNAGIGRHDTKLKKDKVYDYTRHGTAWNVGGGVTWNLSNAVNMDLGYRYLNIGDFKTREGTLKTQNHFVYLGWRYVF